MGACPVRTAPAARPRLGGASAGASGASRRSRPSPARSDPIEELLGLDPAYSRQSGSDGGWHVRQIPAWRAVKDYTCPGCGRVIRQGQAHLVAWRADWIMGDEDAGAGRRHWHPVCWRTRPSR
ncbi:hypothetical protein [Micrococcus luteus]|uniref:hypothetical protein n=1 Tax=Micrococcus luteus TaxID=1270 RepID=UPI0024B0BAAA|nr:hypothetical protein [Micrococcus luteus]